MNENDITFLERLLQDRHCLYTKWFDDDSVSINYHMVLHFPEQIKNWVPTTAWLCFPHERRIGDLSDTLTSGKSEEEQIFNHFFLQLCLVSFPSAITPLFLQWTPCTSLKTSIGNFFISRQHESLFRQLVLEGKQIFLRTGLKPFRVTKSLEMIHSVLLKKKNFLPPFQKVIQA